FGAELLRDRFVDGLIDVRHHLQLDQIGDELEWAPLKLPGQIANDDRRLERDNLAGLRRDKLRFCRRGRRLCRRGASLSLSAQRAGRAAASKSCRVAAALKIRPATRRGRAQRRLGCGLFGGARGGLGGQLDKADLVAYARRGRYGWRWRRRGGQINGRRREGDIAPYLARLDHRGRRWF